MMPELLEEKRNLVLCAPTSAGKSLVSEVLLTRFLLENQQKKAFIVMPFISLI